MLEAVEITYGYSRRKLILQGISLTLYPGEIIALLGPNGSGKSTLLRILAGVRRPLQGEVVFEGVPLSRIPPRILARRIAYLTQMHQAFLPYRVVELVRMGRIPHRSPFASFSSQDEAAVEGALHKLSIAHLRERPYAALSVGQRQLVQLARALAQSSKILILDEPMASLDYGNQWLFLQECEKLAREGYTILFSTHALDHALFGANRTILLRNGRLIAQGPPAKVLTKQLVAELFSIPPDHPYLRQFDSTIKQHA
ncbi:putative Uncharacterized ABC transporter ATP-binding protein HI_1272 [Methylacidiphilum fumariolicum SolV]|nr:putative Uncharacterized ABC transporter ATP-binding protein HI_1272 [Methylacidiphilum fumariolicum SolV]